MRRHRCLSNSGAALESLLCFGLLLGGTKWAPGGTNMTARGHGGHRGGSLIQEGKQLEARILGKGVPMLEERLDHSVPAAGALQNSP